MDDNGPVINALPKLEVFAPVRIDPRSHSRRRNDSSRDESLANSNDPLAGLASGNMTLDFGMPTDKSSWDPSRTLLTAIMTLPSWLVSFIIHLGMLLILATCTYVAQQKGPIFLELSQTSSPNDHSLMEVTFEDPELEESLESFESDEDFESELPSVDLGEQAELPDLYDTADPFAVTGLPEFSSKAMIGSDAGPHDPSEAVEFFGTKAYGSDFVFVIDCSSSMSAEYRWQRAIKELLGTLEQLDSDQKFLVLLYNDRNYVMFGGASSQKLVPATEENKLRIGEWLGDATPFAGTRPGDSVRLALKKKPDAIYFLSDGELRDNTMFDLRFWNVARRGPDGLKRLTPIHTVLLGSNFGRETMRTIAEENNGIFTHAR